MRTITTEPTWLSGFLDDLGVEIFTPIAFSLQWVEV